MYAVIILNNDKIEKSCYGDGISTPMSFIITAKYNDYGCIEQAVDDFASRSTLAMFNQYYKDEKLILSTDVLKYAQNNAKSGYGECGFTEEDGFTDIETLFKNIERGYVSLETNGYGGQKEQSIYFMLMGADELETMWDSINYSEDYNLKNDSWDTVKADIEEFIVETIATTESPKMDKLQIREALKKPGITEEESEELYELMFALSDLDKPWGGDNNYKSVMASLVRYETVNTTSFRKLHYILNGEYKEEIHDEVVKNISEFIMLLKVMNAFRKVWYPQGHSTQYDSFDLVLDYTERFLRKIYKKRQEMADDGGYESGFPQVVGVVPIFEEGKMKCDS